MKIVRVIARLNVGGPAKHVVWLTRGLKSAECETLLVAGSVPPGEDDMGYFASEQGVDPVFIPEMSREISPKDLITIWKLYRLFRRERPDIIHTHTAKAGTVGRIAGLLYRWFTPGALVGQPRPCSLVHTYHGHIFHSYYGKFKTRLFLTIERALARIATDRIVVISEQQRREINQTYGVGNDSRFVVVPLGLDLPGETETGGQNFREELQAKPHEILIGIVGRLTEIKHHQLFLEAAAIYKQLFGAKPELPPVRFIVVGDGLLKEELVRYARKRDLANEVVFVGTRTDLNDVYPALDIVALTSLNEGTPLTLIEAMANRRPVISTAVGGVVDLLGDELERDAVNDYAICSRGISVNPGNAAAFAAGLLRLVSDARLRRELGDRGLQFVSSHYTTDRLIRDIRSLYSELRSEKKATVASRSTEQSHVVD